MSKSRQKNPVLTWTNSKSQKKGKRQCNKRFRKLSRILVCSDKILPRKGREVMDVWNFEGDGKYRVIRSSSQYEKSLKK